jgi:hypothetical protein
VIKIARKIAANKVLCDQFRACETGPFMTNVDETQRRLLIAVVAKKNPACEPMISILICRPN